MHWVLKLAKIALQENIYQIRVATFEEAMELRMAFSNRLKIL
ncbi:hypothetical protein [Campylobacter troglodytis]|nr:hypothetical protein [Campylobacter troglodytis]